jgi:hypothetical protein
VKHLPGRPKTGKLDAVWLRKVAARQMTRPGFVPPPQIRRPRDVTRYRAGLAGAHGGGTAAEKLFEDAQIKMSAVVPGIFGVSGRQMMASMIAGQRDPRAVTEQARGRMRGTITALQEAFTGYFTRHHAFLAGRMLARAGALKAGIAVPETTIEQMAAPLAAGRRNGWMRSPASTPPPHTPSRPRPGSARTSSLPPATWSPGPSSPRPSKNPPGRRRASGLSDLPLSGVAQREVRVSYRAAVRRWRLLVAAVAVTVLSARAVTIPVARPACGQHLLRG